LLPNKFELDVKTVKALGLTVPETVLATADQAGPVGVDATTATSSLGTVLALGLLATVTSNVMAVDGAPETSFPRPGARLPAARPSASKCSQSGHPRI
jgi:hypothetical protein